MAVSLTETIHDLGKLLSEHCLDGSDDFPRRFCEALEPQLLPDFQIGFVGVTGETGDILIDTALLIYTSASSTTDDSPKYVASERVAGVIHAVKILNDESLAEGYKLIGQVKALPGQDTDSVAGWHHIPIGMIVACDCERPLEELADSIATLNTQFPSTRWADAVSVLSRGLINHAVQFEGHKIGGDFILPNKTGAMQFAMYVHVMVASLGSYTFNRMCGLLFMHLGCFFKKTVLPTNEMVMQDVSRVAVNVRAYMFNATDYLVAVPEEMRQDRGYGCS